MLGSRDMGSMLRTCGDGGGDGQAARETGYIKWLPENFQERVRFMHLVDGQGTTRQLV